MPADYLSGLFWLLLPIAAASGWYLARRTAPRPPPQLGPSYVRGLNYLLNEQPDKAIEVFLQMLEVESETVETHLALGNLFGAAARLTGPFVSMKTSSRGPP